MIRKYWVPFCAFLLFVFTGCAIFTQDGVVRLQFDLPGVLGAVGFGLLFFVLLYFTTPRIRETKRGNESEKTSVSR